MFCLLAEVPMINVDTLWFHLPIMYSESDPNSCEMNKITSAMFPPISLF